MLACTEFSVALEAYPLVITPSKKEPTAKLLSSPPVPRTTAPSFLIGLYPERGGLTTAASLGLFGEGIVNDGGFGSNGELGSGPDQCVTSVPSCALASLIAKVSIPLFFSM